jgi:hypothetical protein
VSASALERFRDSTLWPMALTCNQTRRIGSDMVYLARASLSPSLGLIAALLYEPLGSTMYELVQPVERYLRELREFEVSMKVPKARQLAVPMLMVLVPDSKAAQKRRAKMKADEEEKAVEKLDNAETQAFLLEFVRRVNLNQKKEIVIDFTQDVSMGQLSSTLGASEGDAKKKRPLKKGTTSTKKPAKASPPDTANSGARKSEDDSEKSDEKRGKSKVRNGSVGKASDGEKSGPE